MSTQATAAAPTLRLPAAPVLVAGVARAAWLSPDGEIEELPRAEAASRARETPPIVAHAPATSRRLGIERFPAFDLLELFAFVRPAQFCLPTPRGLAAALGLDPPQTLAGEALALLDAARALLAELADAERAADADLVGIARLMTRGGWRWGPAVLAALGDAPEAFQDHHRMTALEIWSRLQAWSEHAPEPPPGNVAVEPTAARQRLAALLGDSAEPRPQQADYASAVTHAFTPRGEIDHPRVVLAEAGTGVGKTLGYLAPATLWAEQNGGPVWISTFTRNLQHQIDRELDRLYLEPEEKARKVVIRKGRENYFCLLNYEEAVRGLATRPQEAVPLGLMARWARASRDGDMVGGDFPAWLADIAGRARTRGLTDRRGECIYSACPHYHKCFIEKSVRRARRADIVIANHALVMTQAALGSLGDASLPTRYVFDEGHHVFGAADGAFSGLLSGQETHDLRRWLLGPEGGRRSRARGLKARAEELAAGDEAARRALDAALQASHVLPGDGWLKRVPTAAPVGPTEAFLALVRTQVYARAKDVDDGYSLETETRPAAPDLLAAARRLEAALARLADPLLALARRFVTRLDAEADELDSATRIRLDGLARGLIRRGEIEIGGWRAMLKALAAETPPEFVDWFAVERFEGHDIDLGMHRHWIDPTKPFADAVARPAHGLIVTSATLTDGLPADGGGDVEPAWQGAETRTGARHLPERQRAAVPSPFDYPRLTRVVVVNDLARDDVAQTASAYRELFLAAGGGALGLFTAISRLRAVYARIAAALEAAGLPLYAQHVDDLDTGTLIDIFRAEPDSCLLGTDAVRDGVDVPGRSLRLIVFDRVPWPRPDILHKARKAAFGGTAYDDMLTRLKLKQAFGRLVRRADDFGVFVMLDSRLPTRLTTAFPPGVAVQRIGLAEAVKTVREFLGR
ncbi:MAG: ATP-dependent DNA helicase [Proteobacteria bacterium]|nr:ATP-dependent DNA helicase [Pseudomonadota bacterium]